MQKQHRRPLAALVIGHAAIQHIDGLFCERLLCHLDSCLNDLGGSRACRVIVLGANDGKAIAVGCAVIIRESGWSSTPRPRSSARAPRDTGYPAFAGYDDIDGRMKEN